MSARHNEISAATRRRRSLWIAVSLAVFTIAQTAFLAWAGALPAHVAPEAWLVSGVLAFIVAQAWLLRHMLPAHADMLLLMMAWGGFGMLLGWHLDGGLTVPMPDAGSTEIHAGAMGTQGQNSHAHHTHDHDVTGSNSEVSQQPHAGHHGVYAGWSRWFNAMNGLMLLFAFPPAVLWARCLHAYRADKLRLAWVLALDAMGMAVGMLAGGRGLGHGLGDMLSAPALGHHLGMLAGMMLGMYASMMLRRWGHPSPRSALIPGGSILG